MADDTQPDSVESAKRDRSPDQVEASKRRSGATSLKSGRRPLLAAAAIGLVAGAVGGMAVAGWWRPASGASAEFSEEQVAEAKADVCSAALVARQAVAKNMHLINPDPENPLGQLAVAANARMSLAGSAAYLRGRLDADAAAPPDVAKAAGEMAGSLEHLNISYLVGESDADHEQLGRDLDKHITELGGLCQ